MCNEARKPKGAKLLAILPSSAGSGGEDEDAWEFVGSKNPKGPNHDEDIHVQTWGMP